MHTHSYETTSGEIHAHDVTDLWAHTAALPVEHLPLEVAVRTFNGYINTFDSDDWDRVIEADLSYPIIFNDTYGVVDGCHRCVKAMLLGEIHIAVKRMATYPAPKRIFSSWEDYNKADTL